MNFITLNLIFRQYGLLLHESILNLMNDFNYSNEPILFYINFSWIIVVIAFFSAFSFREIIKFNQIIKNITYFSFPIYFNLIAGFLLDMSIIDGIKMGILTLFMPFVMFFLFIFFIYFIDFYLWYGGVY